MQKFLTATATMFALALGLQAAPTLGVEWRAPANAKVSGVRIMSVDAGGNGAELGLEEGNLVLAINDKVVRTGKEATAAVVAANGTLKLLLQESKNGKLIEITAVIDEPTKGFNANPNAKAKYKNITRKMK